MLKKLNGAKIRRGLLGVLMLLLVSFMTGSLRAAHALGANPPLTGTNFNSSFNTNHTGWSPVTGGWSLVGSAYYKGTGASGLRSSIMHSGTYGHLDYSVRMKRTSSENDLANSIMIRGDPFSLSSYNDWNTCYNFQYTNFGEFSVYKDVGGTFTKLKGWTVSGSINKGGWNTLKVIAIGSALKFYINGTLVWSGNNSALSIGYVGVSLNRGNTSTNDWLSVDWAKLSTTATTSPNLSEVAAPGVEMPGGDENHSP